MIGLMTLNRHQVLAIQVEVSPAHLSSWRTTHCLVSVTNFQYFCHGSNDYWVMQPRKMYCPWLTHWIYYRREMQLCQLWLQMQQKKSFLLINVSAEQLVICWYAHGNFACSLIRTWEFLLFISTADTKNVLVHQYEHGTFLCSFCTAMADLFFH